MPVIIPNEYQIYRFISIDPGSVNTGIAIYELDLLNRKIKSIEACTINTDKLLNKTGLDEEYFSERLLRLYKLKLAISDFVLRVSPFAVVCESPFYNRFRPMAYGALLETLSVIQAAVLEINPNILFKTVEPLLVKRTVGAGIMKGKIDMKVCIDSNIEITSVANTDLDTLDEHAYDAIAVGYCFIKHTGILL